MVDWDMKRNDTSPAFEMQCQNNAGDGVDISNAVAKFHLAEYNSGNIVVDKIATITDETQGKVKYQWEPEDTETAGLYGAEVEVTYQDGEVETFPNDKEENPRVKIHEDLS